MLSLLHSHFVKLLRKQAGEQTNKIITACIASGVLQGLAVFTVLQGLEQLSGDGIRFHTFLAFLICLSGFYFLFRYITGEAALIALQGVMEWRMRIATKLRAVALEKYEQFDLTRIQAALLDGREMVVEAARMLAATVANSIMIVVAVIKMFTISVSGSIGVIACMTLGLFVFLQLAKSVHALMGPAMQADTQFSANLRDLQEGLQQLKQHKPKTTDLFEQQILAGYDTASHARANTERRHALGISFFAMFNLLILGLILFLMPKFLDVTPDQTSQLLVLCMFSLSPLMSVVAFVPLFAKVEMSLQELAQVENIMDDALEPFEEKGIQTQWQYEDPNTPDFTSLRMENVKFSYMAADGTSPFGITIDSFSVKKGELLFIRGGNGSGKSTFMKVLSGLYLPQTGTVHLNDRPIADIGTETYRNMFTILPTEYHLFSRPLGLDVSQKRFENVLKTMRIENKIQLRDDGTFSTLDLSAGQRKRVALACALLEERDIYILDEVAADFDPAFRKFFYEELLPSITAKGITIIAISHDDRYFHVADRIITMQEGTMEKDGESK
ncbi:MAG: ATP-binding cassette domain-containing protein [Desulfovibrio sp.]